jgi:hypothetical protein
VQVQQQPDQGLVVLEIVLQQLCLEDVEFLCTLLCCSKATAAVVNQTCAGQLSVTETDEICSEEGTWLAKHAQLLRVLHVDVCDIDDEEWVAAGLRAAAGAPSMAPAAGAARAAASRQRIQQAEAAARQAVASLQAAPAPAGSGVRMLPLQELQLKSDVQLHGSLLPTISACCRQLTQLEFFHVGEGDISPADLSPLRNLQNLTIMCDEEWTAATLASISSLTQLTFLQTKTLEPEYCEHLPASLVMLFASTHENRGFDVDDLVERPPELLEADLSHLTNLTYLHLDAAPCSEDLPPSLQELVVRDFTWDDGFLQLQELHSLKFDIYWHWAHRGELPNLGPMTKMTQLTALRLGVITTKDDMGWTLPELCSNLPQLPLLELKTVGMDFDEPHVMDLGGCTQLTSLTVNDSIIDCSIGEFSKQLLRMQDLEKLSLVTVKFTPRVREAKDAQPLINALAKLCSKGQLACLEITTHLLLSSQHDKKLKGLLKGELHRVETMSEDYDDDEYDFGF